MAKHREYNFKSLLNKGKYHSISAVSCNFEEITRFNKGKLAIDGELNISDCNRVVSLNLDCYDVKEKKNTLNKINTLIKALNGAKEFVESVEVGKKG